MAQNPAKIALDAAKAVVQRVATMPAALVKQVVGTKPREVQNNTQLTKIAQTAGRK